jgi:predicted O-methyltransferase YrrM
MVCRRSTLRRMVPDLLAVPSSSPLSLYRYRDGLYAADLLTTAIVEFDVFTWLDAHPSTLPGLCAHFGFHPRPADVMLTLFVARGYVERDGDVFRVAAVGREHLTSGSPWFLGPYYGALKERPFVQDFARVLRSGQPATWGGTRNGQDWHLAMHDEAFARRFTAAMDCRGVYLGEALARAVDLSAHRRVLDVGGGSGIYACALAARHSHLRATILDQAPVAPIARTLVAERGFADTIDVVAADFFSQPLPAGYDVHLYSNVLHDWDAPEVRHLLWASFASLPPGGLVVIHDAFINADKTGPVPVAEYSVLLMHASQGRCYATSEYAAMLHEAGFVDCRHQDTVADRGVMTARRP